MDYKLPDERKKGNTRHVSETLCFLWVNPTHSQSHEGSKLMSAECDSFKKYAHQVWTMYQSIKSYNKADVCRETCIQRLTNRKRDRPKRITI